LKANEVKTVVQSSKPRSPAPGYQPSATKRISVITGSAHRYAASQPITTPDVPLLQLSTMIRWLYSQ
jgi:hypothetical protein